jgi:hypothetical protein
MVLDGTGGYIGTVSCLSPQSRSGPETGHYLGLLRVNERGWRTPSSFRGGAACLRARALRCRRVQLGSGGLAAEAM